MDEYKVVIRNRIDNHVAQIVECYARDRADAVASAKRTYGESYPDSGYSFTASLLLTDKK